MPTVAESCRDAILTVIRALDLEFVADDEVQTRDAPADWAQWPHRGISVIPLTEREKPGTNQSEDYGYPFLIVRSRGTAKGNSELKGEHEDWRNAVRKAFNHKRLSGVTQVCICTVGNGEWLQNRPWTENKALSTLVVTCWARESRNP